MNSFKILLLNNFNMFVGRLKGKKGNNSKIGSGVIFVGAILILLLCFVQAYSMCYGMHLANADIICVFHAVLTSLSLVVILGIMRSATSQKFNDEDFLLSMPIKKWVIILSKTVNKYIFDFFIIFILFFPYAVFYMFFAGFNFWFLIGSILYVILMPLLSVGISYIADFLFNKLLNKIKIGSIFKNVITVFIFVTIMILLITKTSSYGLAFGSNLNDFLLSRPISNFILGFFITPNVFNILAVLLLPVLVFSIGVLIYTMTYGKFNSSFVSKSKKMVFTEPKQPFQMLFKKELYKYATTPAYLINTIIGLILLIAGAFYISFFADEYIAPLLASLPKEMLIGIIVIAFSFIMSTSAISASSISLEGKNFWLLKTMPVKESSIFNSKAMVHISISLPFLLIACVCFSVSQQFNFLQIVMLLSLCVLSLLIIAYGGLLFNLWLPILDFEDETKVVKQGGAVLLTLLLGLVLAVIPFGVYKLFSGLEYLNMYLIILFIYITLLSAILTITYTLGKKLFRKI